jgi:hypothetical protein
VKETIELVRELVDGLGLPVGPPIANGVPPRRFTADEAAQIDALAASSAHPHVAAARFQIERRAQADVQLAALKRGVHAAPVRLPFLYDAPESPEGVAALAAELVAETGLR